MTAELWHETFFIQEKSLKKRPARGIRIPGFLFRPFWLFIAILLTMPYTRWILSGFKCNFTQPRFVAVVWVSIFLSAGCTSIDHNTNQSANQTVQVEASAESSGHLIETDAYEFIGESLEEEIITICKKLDLAPLPKTASAKIFEFRLWTNLGGLGDAKLLLIRTWGDQYRATFFTVHRALDPTEFQKADQIVPRSGWNKLLYDLRNRLTVPKGLVRDPQFDLGRDEPVILLEVLDKGEYRRVFYGQYTSFPDGKRLIEVCDYLASEFSVNMECRSL